MTDLTHERLREALEYDPATGAFSRLIPTANGRYKPGPTGSKEGGRYWFVWLDGKAYLGHRLAWFWMTGAWPSHQIDHINIDKFDNRWANLRESTISQNAMNRKGWAKSGLKGVYFLDDQRKCGSKQWRASIAKDGKIYRLGNFHTKEEAKAAYDAAALRLHGEFARAA